ncbi:hypothetical protein HMPREF9621_01949 [Cutibacterium modestum HL037PA2]|nr:hypothetical protein HMPREF9621_01949 [Cutibacterium modestum HL037PA2]
MPEPADQVDEHTTAIGSPLRPHPDVVLVDSGSRTFTHCRPQ